MSDKFPTPWGHGGSGAPEGDDWVWAYSRNLGGSSYDDPPEMEDTRLFSAPPEVAAEVVRAVNNCAEWERVTGFKDPEALSFYLSRQTIQEDAAMHGRVLAEALNKNAETREELLQVKKERNVLRFVADCFNESVEAAGMYMRRPQGGQHVPFHGDFANITPSVLGQLERFVRRFKDVGSFDYTVSYLTSQLEASQAEAQSLRKVIKQVDELADTQPSYWVVSIIKATQAALRGKF